MRGLDWLTTIHEISLVAKCSVRKNVFLQAVKPIFLRICVLCAVKALPFPLPSSQAPPSRSQVPSGALGPGLGRQAARQPASAKPNTAQLGRPPLSGQGNHPGLPLEGIWRNLMKYQLAFCSSGNFGLNWLLHSKFTTKGQAGGMAGRQCVRTCTPHSLMKLCLRNSSHTTWEPPPVSSIIMAFSQDFKTGI